MKYLQSIDSLYEDIIDESYNEITVPSVRYIQDTNEVVARTTTIEKNANLINLVYLFSLTSENFSGLTYGDYIEKLYNGDYTSTYASKLTLNSSNGEEFIKNYEDETIAKIYNYDFSLLESLLSVLYNNCGTYDNVEASVADFVSYSGNYGEASFSGESATTVINMYEALKECFDLNGDGIIDKSELNLLIQFKKFFPEYVTTAAYTSAKAILEDGEHTIEGFVECLLGVATYDSTYDLNGNGEIDEEDMCFFISAHIFGDLGITDTASTKRNAIRKANATNFSSNPEGGKRPPRSSGSDGPGWVTVKVHGSGTISYETTFWKKEERYLNWSSNDSVTGGTTLLGIRFGGRDKEWSFDFKTVDSHSSKIDMNSTYHVQRYSGTSTAPGNFTNYATAYLMQLYPKPSGHVYSDYKTTVAGPFVKTTLISADISFVPDGNKISGSWTTHIDY